MLLLLLLLLLLLIARDRPNAGPEVDEIGLVSTHRMMIHDAVCAGSINYREPTTKSYCKMSWAAKNQDEIILLQLYLKVNNIQALVYPTLSCTPSDIAKNDAWSPTLILLSFRCVIQTMQF